MNNENDYASSLYITDIIITKLNLSQIGFMKMICHENFNDLIQMSENYNTLYGYEKWF